MPGTFITLEGIDGSGKTTQAQVLIGHLRERGLEVVALREPGGTAISEKIRALLLDPANSDMCAVAELLLYEASRAQLVSQVVAPALARGAWVVCDRYYDSTTAYQAAGRALDNELVSRANALGSCGVDPDITLVFDLDPTEAYARATEDGCDRLEAEGVAFQQKVREGYLALSAREPERVHVVDAAAAPEVVSKRMFAELAGFIGSEGTVADKSVEVSAQHDE